MTRLAGDVLDACESCTEWVPVDELDEETGVCWWCELRSNLSCSALAAQLARARLSAEILDHARTTGG